MSTDQIHPVVDRRVSANGYDINVRVEGVGEPLLLINGLTRSLGSWAPFANVVSGRQIITFDAPGVGESPNSHLPLSIAQLATICVGILDELGLDRVDVLGYSLGGAVAQEMAARYAMRVRRLVLAATSCGMGSTLAGCDMRDSATILMNGLFRANPLSTMWRVMALSSWTSIPYLGTLETPTLVVCGRDDRVAPIANSRALARRIPNATMVELPAGHDLQEPVAAEQLARVVEAFLARDTHSFEDHFAL